MGSNPPQGGSGSGTVINALSDVEDVTISGNRSGEILKWNGSAWINQTLAETGIQTTLSNAAIKTAYEANADSNEFSDAEQSKLAAIEASATADQTNAEIVAAVEAGADSNTFTDADHSKLNAIEASATADQTASEIKTAYESNSDTNEFSDAEQTKLAGIAANANNYTHTTNANLTGEVTSSGNAATITDDIVDEANLKVDNSPTNDYVLTAKSSAAGGLTWKVGGGGNHTVQDWDLQGSTPADPGTDTGRMYMKDIDSNNEGLFMKIKKNGTVSEVQVL